MNLLTALYVTGTAVFAAGAVAAVVLGVWLWWWQRRENPAHLVVMVSFGAMVLYATLWTDYNVYLRPSDGVEVSWVRGAFNIAALVLYSHMDIESVWMSWWRGWTYVALNALVGVLLLAADLAGPEHWRGWYCWTGAVALALVVHLIAWWHMRRPGAAAHFTKLGWAAFVCVALPLTQALSYTMAQTLDKSPHRGTTEIVYVIIYGVWVLLWGCAVAVLYQPFPAELMASRATKKAEGAASYNADSQIGAQAYQTPSARSATLSHRRSTPYA